MRNSTVKRAIRNLTIVAVVLLLASCGVFFVPKQGRWNVEDPDNELETFTPSVDGYTYISDGWHDGAELLRVHSDTKLILIRFNAASFPDTIATSYLKLTVASGPGAGGTDLEIYRVIGDWDPPIDFTTAANQTTEMFFDDAAKAVVTIPSEVGGGDEILIPLDNVFSGGKDQLKYGIIIFSFPDLMEFESMELGAGPVLLVEPG